MRTDTLKIALFSPDQAVVPSTFINAHKTLLSGHISYFYSGWCPTHLEGVGKLFSMPTAVWYLFKNKILANKLNYKQQALKKALKRVSPDVCFAEYGITAAKVLPICEDLKIPMVVIFHGADAHEKPVLDEYGHVYQRLFQYADSIIVVSQYMKKHLMSLGCPEQKLVWTPCAPNDAFFKVVNQPIAHHFVAVGRFTAKKSPQTTLKAFAKVLEKYPNATLSFGGEGDLLSICKQLVTDLGIQRAVNFLGQITSTQLQSLFSSAFAFIQHSVTAESGDMEGTPVVVMEANAAGLPVVATNHAGIPDIIQDGVNGFLIDEHDLEGMANAMIRLADNPEQARTMGLKGRDIVFNNFSMDKHIATIDLAIQKAAKSV